jgi:endo-1,4-beta-xylanase
VDGRSPISSYLALVAALTGLVLLVACTNVGGMVLARSINRTREMSLRLALGADRLVGSAVDVNALADDREYRRVLAREFNYVTAENSMKWAPVHPAPDTWDFAAADSIVAFARRHGMAVKGHALVWHEQLPDYVFGAADGEALHAMLTEHIRGVVGHYRDRVRAWDVVNEPIALTGGGLRRTLFLELLGPGYIAEALRLAHAADPMRRSVLTPRRRNEVVSPVDSLPPQASSSAALAARRRSRMPAAIIETGCVS